MEQLTEEFREMVEEQQNGKRLHSTDEHHFYLAKGQSGEWDIRDVKHDENRIPKRKTGNPCLGDVESFNHYVNKHQEPGVTEIYADMKDWKVVAVLNGHSGEDEAGWGDHRATLSLKHSKDFRAWERHEGQKFTQAAFARFLQDHRADVSFCPGEYTGLDGVKRGNPTPVELSNLVCKLERTSKQKVVSNYNPQTGAKSFSFTEEESGRASEMEPPPDFRISIPIFEGTKRQAVVVGLRMGIERGELTFSFSLDQIETIQQEVFEEVLKEVENGKMIKDEDGENVLGFKGCKIKPMKGTP